MANSVARTGIGPDGFSFDSNAAGMTFQQKLFFEEHGFYITSAGYYLRPEVLESNFYAWRVTGDQKYVDRARQATKSIQSYLRFERNGERLYSGIGNVNEKQPQHLDGVESFWYAEVLKYL